MRSFITLAGFLALVIVWYSYASDAALDGKTPLEKALAPEFENLVRNLGDKDFKIRERASKQIAKTRGALTMLRSFSNEKDLERRKRVAALVDQIHQRNFKNLLGEIVSRKQKAPLDFLVDLVAYNSERMDGEDWNRVLETIASIKSNVLKEAKIKPNIPAFNLKFFATPFIPLAPAEMPILRRVRRCKVSGDKVDLLNTHVLEESAVVATGSIKCIQCFQCVIIAAGSIELSDCSECIILGNGGVSFRARSLPDRSFLFTNADLNCNALLDSVAIVRGHLKTERTRASEVIEARKDSSRVTLFSMRTVGLVLVAQDQGFHVEKVITGSPAEKSGFRKGDIILSQQAKEGRLQDFERELRQTLAKQTEAVLQVHREDRQLALILSFFH